MNIRLDCARCPYIALHLRDLLRHAEQSHGVRPAS